MYDPKFEKEIQRKMEELEFRPAESVWVSIEKAVMVKRRRRAGFFWRYLLPGAFLVAAAGLYMHYNAEKAKDPRMTAGSLVKHDERKALRPNEGTTEATDGAMVEKGARVTSARGQKGQTSAAAADGRSRQTTGTTPRGREDLTSGTSIKVQKDRTIAEAAKGPATADATRDPATADATKDQTNMDATKEETNTDATKDLTSGAGHQGLADWFYLPGLTDQRLAPRVQGAALNSKKSNIVTLSSLSQPNSRWEAGFVAGGGLSRMNHLNVSQAQSVLAATAVSLYSIAGSSSSENYISDIRAGASFDGGIYLQRPLSDRWIFNTGMNLHYYSNRISVGEQLPTYVSSSYSYVIPNTLPTSVSQSTVYSAGDRTNFTNKYYFLELPVGIQWKVSKNHLLPIFLEGGFSLSRLMGASALFYDAKTGLYSKNGDVVNKTQLNISSALLIGLPIHGIRLQVGPQIQYGLTPIVNTQGLGDQHLLYTGLRLVLIPGRK